MYCDVFGGSSVWEYFFTWSWNCISMCAYILGVLRDRMDMVFAKVRIMESILNIDFCGINESLVSGNAG